MSKPTVLSFLNPRHLFSRNMILPFVYRRSGKQEALGGS